MMPKKPAFKVEANELDSVTTEIKIGDKICDCQSLTLKQSMYGHSTFEIVVNYKTQDKSIWEINPDELIKQQLGEKVRISIKHLAGGEALERKYRASKEHLERSSAEECNDKRRKEEECNALIVASKIGC